MQKIAKSEEKKLRIHNRGPVHVYLLGYLVLAPKLGETVITTRNILFLQPGAYIMHMGRVHDSL